MTKIEKVKIELVNAALAIDQGLQFTEIREQKVRMEYIQQLIMEEITQSNQYLKQEVDFSLRKIDLPNQPE